jgi:sialate O-acetylesterase
MNKLKYFSFILFLILLSFHFFEVSGQIRLPGLISDGMVLQRDTELKIWGWAEKGQNIRIDFLGKQYNTVCNPDGKWEILLPAQSAGGPYNMEISSVNRITVKDILFGDVWVCSGQSNMELKMERVKYKYPEIIAKSENTQIRLFQVPMFYNFKNPESDIKSGKWISVNPDNILQFTAVGYFFAKSLFEKYQVPIGIISSSVGGSPAEAWISEEALKPFPESLKMGLLCKNDSYIDSIRNSEKEISNHWYQLAGQKDAGRLGKIPWCNPQFDSSAWPIMQLPDFWTNTSIGNNNGIVWFRKDFEVPGSLTGKPGKLLLGRIVDSDSAFLNGQFVGYTSYQYPPRIYDIVPGILKPGKNTLVVKVINNSGRGGFIKDKPYQINISGESVDLTGTWQYHCGAVMPSLPGTTFFQYKPFGLYNGMIAPLLNYRINGVCWYQGESNSQKPLEYSRLLSTLISDWRQKWNQGDFSFLLVQLPNFMEPRENPTESNWALMRDVQRRTLSVKNTGMAITIDLGEWNDIHPLNKEDVGKRLALAAQNVAYNDKSVVGTGPLFQSAHTDGNQIILSFTNVGGGLISKDGKPLKYFAVAGTDKKFVWANAKIDGDNVIVWNDSVPNPVFVRYAWADNPAGVNFYNAEGLPASPFTNEE